MRTRHHPRPGRGRAVSLTALLVLGGALLLSAACGSKTPPATTPAPAAPPAVAPVATPPPATTPAGAKTAVQPAPPSAAAAKSPAKPAPSNPPAAQAPAPSPSTPAGTAPKPPVPPPLLGHVSRVDLKAYESWQPLFAAAPYAPDPGAVATIKSSAQDVTVLMIMATWCPDSKRELPRYFVIMDAAAVTDSTLTMVGVDRTKKDAEGLTEKWGISRVPTFVFFRKGQEIGRVVERVPAGGTLEAEIAKVLGGK